MEKRSSQQVYRTIMLVIITVLITSLVTTIVIYNFVIKSGKIAIKSDDNSSLGGLEATLASFRSVLEEKYMGEIDDETLIEGAIKGYVSALGDPYTTYYTKEEMDELMEETTGNYVGIGIYMTLDLENNAIYVVKPMEGSPAEEAGIKAGDLITKVDGIEYSGEELDQASNAIKGKEGTKVKLEILSNGQTREIEVERRKIIVSHIVEKKFDNIGYLLIEDFDGGCADEFEEKYKELEKQGIDRLIIDLRNNGGGVVNEAVDIADMLLEKDKTILITKDKKGNEEVKKCDNEASITMPVVVLTNGYSASASEILVGALKDNERATIVGTKTYGKGVIQEVDRLNDGSGLKITIEEYYTPNRDKINKVGIKPDEEIELSSEIIEKGTYTDEEDNQLQKAIEIIKRK
ncbi:carboxy-terminal processing protease [Clostridium sp. CAG:273]|nr:carboxy-terminal processing protease [Clostridium sp. CAG:273]